MSSQLNKYIFIDADDTLWENEQYFRDAETEFAQAIAPGMPADEIQQILWQKQEEFIPWFGYGSKTYFMGMTAAATELLGSVDASTLGKIKDIIVHLSHHKVEVFEGVEPTLAELSAQFSLVLATKGETLEQISKIKASGLAKYFSGIEVMVEKDEEGYIELGARYGVAPEELVMVGNSVRSDVLPVIKLEGTAYYIPHEIAWTHELAELPISERLICIDRFADLVCLLKH